jgi:hypothetical protein
MYGSRSGGGPRAGVARRDVGLLLPSLVRLDVTGGELPDGRGVIWRFVRLGAGDGENEAMNIQVCPRPSSDLDSINFAYVQRQCSESKTMAATTTVITNRLHPHPNRIHPPGIQQPAPIRLAVAFLYLQQNQNEVQRK